MSESISPLLFVLQVAQLIISIIFPIGLLMLLFFAWRDFRRLVNHRVAGQEMEEADEELSRSVKEFSE